MPSPLRCGLFIPPIPSPGESPTLLLERNLELIQHCARLGYHEAWIGEHHSGGWEIIAAPELFIATAAKRTRHIRLGTGVNSLACHHPLILADGIVLLDHLTCGRIMMGIGPGSLAAPRKAWAEMKSDAAQLKATIQGAQALAAERHEAERRRRAAAASE